MRFFKYIADILNKGEYRSVIIKKNILGSFIVKGFSIGTTILLVPITLQYLDSEKYGIWITLFSIVSWFNMMDIGLGNGFRNKFAESVASRDLRKARKYVETLYGFTAVVSIGFFLIFSIVHPLIDWKIVLNLSNNFNENISLITWYVFGLFSLQLVLKNIKVILLALQKTALNNLIGFIPNLLSLIVILILGYFKIADLKSIALVFMFSPVLVMSLASLLFFKKEYEQFCPRNIMPEKELLTDMMNLGFKFFFIQITTLVLFGTGSILVTQLFGPEKVTPYNISYRLYASLLGIFSIITVPFWSAYTEAITLDDYTWIKRSIKKLNLVWILFVIGIASILALSPLIFRVWIGDSVVIPLALSVSFAVYAVLLSWTSIYAQFLNGVGKVKLQLYIAIIQCISNIPLAIFLVKAFGFGPEGVILATNLNLLISAILLPIQVNKIYNKTAKGIWCE